MAADGEPVTLHEGGPLTVKGLMSMLVERGFDDRWGRFGTAVVQVTADGEHFYAINDLIDYADAGVVFSIEPWPASDRAAGVEGE